MKYQLCFSIVVAILLQPFQALSSPDEIPGEYHFSFSKTRNHSKYVDLLEWDIIYKPIPKPIEDYDRKRHFGRWRDFPIEPSCLNTRHLVLNRDSLIPPTFSSKSDCYIAEGKWYDPYTDNFYTKANEVQIEHIVPLKKAFLAGASEWTPERRCAYFNFLGSVKHLIPIEAGVNYDKLDKGPEEWMPPNPQTHCSYISWWLTIKYSWGLVIGKDEAYAINSIAKKCAKNQFLVSKVTVNKMQTAIDEATAVCRNYPAQPD